MVIPGVVALGPAVPPLFFEQPEQPLLATESCAKLVRTR